MVQIFLVYFGIKLKKVSLINKFFLIKQIYIYLPRSHAAIAARLIISETFDPVGII